MFREKFYKNQSDEQKLLEKHGKLFLSPKRVNAIKNAERESYEIAILDDGLQDRTINCDLNFVCFNTINWKGNGLTIPAGPLRENIKKISKNDLLEVNKEIINNYIIKVNESISLKINSYRPYKFL